MRTFQTAAVATALTLAVPTLAHAQNAAPPPTGPTMASAGVDSLAVARKFTAWFFTGQMDSLWAHQSAEVKKAFSAAAMLERLMQFAGQTGVEEKVLEERFVKRLGKTQYWRTSQYSGGGEPFMLRLAFSPQGELVGMGFNPRSQAPPVDK